MLNLDKLLVYCLILSFVYPCWCSITKSFLNCTQNFQACHWLFGFHNRHWLVEFRHFHWYYYINLQINKKRRLIIDLDIHISKVFSSEFFVCTYFPPKGSVNLEVRGIYSRRAPGLTPYSWKIYSWSPSSIVE